jgi:hypothetical protein
MAKAPAPAAEHLTERQKQWFAAIRTGLERDTGKTLDEWVAIARTCPETAMRARVNWLREVHGLGVNRAATIMGAAFPSDMGWDQPDRLREDLWKDPASTAILAAIESAVADYPGLVTGQRKTFTAWSKAFQFAAVKPVKGGKARLGLVVTPDADPRFEAPKNESWSERLKSSVTLDGPEDVNDALKALLKASFEKS